MLGFLRSSLKLTLEERYGIQVKAATRSSLLLEYIIGLIAAGLITPQIIFEDLFGFGLILAPLVCSICLLDYFMRYGQLAELTSLQYGAFEWVFRRL